MNAANQLMEIKIEIKDLVERALDIVREEGTPRMINEAKAYWYAQILTKLDKDHDYLGVSMYTMEDTIKKINKENQEIVHKTYTHKIKSN